MSLSVITCSGGRPEAFEISRQLMNRQDFKGEVQWIVVDDGVPHEADEIDCQYPITRIFPTPPYSGTQTLNRNLLAALEAIQYDKIVIWENDDCYQSDYLRLMSEALDRRDIVGCQSSRYYHLPTKRWWVMQHPSRSSLNHTGLLRKHARVLVQACNEPSESPYVDCEFWAFTHRDLKLFLDEPLCTGIKGLPGRRGIGIGHRPEGREWKPDPDLSVLREWTGANFDLYCPRFAA